MSEDKKLSGNKRKEQGLQEEVIPNYERMQLEKVIGNTSENQNQICVNPRNGDIIYIAGCFLVVYSPKESKQIFHLRSRNDRPFQSVTISKDGNFIAAGEAAFKNPEIMIWMIEYQILPSTKAINYVEVKSLRGHKFGIEALRFSPDISMLVSLGNQNDKGLFVWNWRDGVKMSQNKLSKPVLTLQFCEKQEFFVTGGYHHLKFWHMDEQTLQPKKKSKNEGVSIMESVSANIESVKYKVFVGIAILDQTVYSLTRDGYIYVFDKAGSMIKFINIKVDRAFDCFINMGRIFCACSDAVLRVLNTDTLQHLVTMQKPPPLGQSNILEDVKKISPKIPVQDYKFADVVCCIADDLNQRVITLYSDKMMFIWDVKQLEKMSVYRTFLSHRGPIHDIQKISNLLPVGLNLKKQNALKITSEQSGLTKFVTCSSDRTIRFWNHIDPSIQQTDVLKLLQRNAYCKDMSNVVFVESNPSVLKKDSATPMPNSENYYNFKALPPDRVEDGSPIPVDDQQGIMFREMSDAIRCVKVSPEGRFLACGDWFGNLRIYDLTNPTKITQKKFIEAHETEIICLAFSPPIFTEGRYWLASGSRDKSITIYDSDHDFQVIMVLNHHQSTVTNLQFTLTDGGSQHLNLVSCSTDKKIIKFQIDLKPIKKLKQINELQYTCLTQVFKVVQSVTCQGKVYSMDICEQQQFLATGHEKSLVLWDLVNLNSVWEHKSIDQGEVQLKVQIDLTGSIVISSSTLKTVTLFNITNGTPLAICSLGEITTAMCLTQNFKYLIAASDKGVIYYVRLTEAVYQILHAKAPLSPQKSCSDVDILANFSAEKNQMFGSNEITSNGNATLTDFPEWSLPPNYQPKKSIQWQPMYQQNDETNSLQGNQSVSNQQYNENDQETPKPSDLPQDYNELFIENNNLFLKQAENLQQERKSVSKNFIQQNNMMISEPSQVYDDDRLWRNPVLIKKSVVKNQGIPQIQNLSLFDSEIDTVTNSLNLLKKKLEKNEQQSAQDREKIAANVVKWKILLQDIELKTWYNHEAQQQVQTTDLTENTMNQEQSEQNCTVF